MWICTAFGWPRALANEYMYCSCASQIFIQLVQEFLSSRWKETNLYSNAKLLSHLVLFCSFNLVITFLLLTFFPQKHAKQFTLKQNKYYNRLVSGYKSVHFYRQIVSSKCLSQGQMIGIDMGKWDIGKKFIVMRVITTLSIPME